jgi:hypothetical protein
MSPEPKLLMILFLFINPSVIDQQSTGGTRTLLVNEYME